MCEPISAGMMFAASLAVNAVTGIVQYVGEQKMAQAQYDTQIENAKNAREATIADMILKSQDLQAREREERAAAGVDMMNASKKAEAAAATAQASSESAGLSIGQLTADFQRQYASYSDARLQQLGFSMDQIARNREAIQADAESRINSIPMEPVQFPSLGMTLLGIGAGALKSYQTFSAPDPITGNSTLF